VKKRIVIKGPLLSRSGYGEQARFAWRALKSREDVFDIFIINTNWGTTGQIVEPQDEIEELVQTIQKTAIFAQGGGQFDLSLQVTIPNEFEKIAPVNIGYTAGIETTKIAPEWIQKCNQMVDKVIVVSEHSQKVFEQTTYDVKDQNGNEMKGWGVEVPVVTVNYPVRDFEPQEANIELVTDNNFLVVSQWGPRKNMENTITWFVETFRDRDDVGLIVKTNIGSDSVIDRHHTMNRMENLLRQTGDYKCKVYVIHGEVSPAELTWLYQHPTMKALINIGHGEGYGLPLFEAAYNGLSLISPTWSGQMDFMCKPNKKGKRVPRINKVDYNLEDVQKSAVWPGVIQADSKWCFVKENSYKEALQGALEKETHYKKEATTLQAHIRENFTPEKMYENFVTEIYNPSPEEEEWLEALSQIEIL